MGNKQFQHEYLPRSKRNQTIKFVQLREYNIRNIFVEIILKVWWKDYSQTPF